MARMPRCLPICNDPLPAGPHYLFPHRVQKMRASSLAVNNFLVHFFMDFSNGLDNTSEMFL